MPETVKWLLSVGCVAYTVGCGGGDVSTDDSCESEPCDCERPQSSSCASACEAAELLDQEWSATSTALEDRVRDLVNEQRAQGACCGTNGCFAPAGPLVSSPLLRASARRHAREMALNSYISHVSLDGQSAFERMRSGGFDGCALAENIARSQEIAEAVMSSWMASSEHCANIMWDGVSYIGVGYYRNADDSYEHYWVQDFGR